MFATLLANFGGWIVAVLAAVAGLVGIYLKGRSTGRQVERVERDEKINEQAAEARQEVRNVENEIDRSDDAAVLEHAGKWVRKQPPTGGR